jgi:hypothetical protein
MRDSLQQSLKQLRLSGMAASLDVRLSEASGNRLDHAEFLSLVLQDELAVPARYGAAPKGRGSEPHGSIRVLMRLPVPCAIGLRPSSTS